MNSLKSRLFPIIDFSLKLSGFSILIKVNTQIMIENLDDVGS